MISKIYHYEGPTMGCDTQTEEYDHHCPQMGPGLNTYKWKCEERQKSNKRWNKTCVNPCIHTDDGPPVSKIIQAEALWKQDIHPSEAAVILDSTVDVMYKYRSAYRKKAAIKEE